MLQRVNDQSLADWQLREIDAAQPLEVSLFIGGREFPLKDVGHKDGVPIQAAVGDARDSLLRELSDNEQLEREARFNDMSVGELQVFLALRLRTLETILEQIT